MRQSLPTVIPTPLRKMELLDYSRGINSFEANDIVQENALVVATDARISTHGRYKTRQGLDFYSVPAGETVDVQQTSTTGAAESTITTAGWFAKKYTAGATGRLTKVELNLKNDNSGTSVVIVEVWSNSAGEPYELLASSSVPATTPTGSFAYCTARFVEAPQVASGTDYWIVAYLQDDGTNDYKWSNTTNATTALASSDSGVTWAATTYDLNTKTYVSTDSPTLGIHRAYKSDGTKKTLMAHGTNLYSINDITGALTSIKSGLTANGLYRFDSVDDVVYYVNGQDGMRKWDFTTESANSGSTVAATNLILHKDQMFYVDKNNPTKMFWTDKTAFETFTSTNFLYVPSPKSPDPISALAILNDNLFVFTNNTKWALYGSDLSTFVLRKSTGLKGTYSQRQVQSDRNHAYFISDDGIYRFNGATDELISESITDTFKSIANKSTITTALTKNRFYVFYTPSGGAQNSACLVYNINYGSWESIDQNTYINETTNFDTAYDDDEFIQASNIVGAVYYAESDTNAYTNLGKAMEFELRTKYEFFENPSSKKRLKRWYPRFAAQSSGFYVSCQYDKDFTNNPATSSQSLASGGTVWGSGALWGSFTWGATALIAPRISIPGRAKYIQFRIKRTGVNNIVEFYGHTLLYMVQRPR